MKLNNVVAGVLTLVELGGIAALTAIALKRNEDCFKAEMKLIDCEAKLWLKGIENVCKDSEIKSLNKQLESLKKEEES